MAKDIVYPIPKRFPEFRSTRKVAFDDEIFGALEKIP
jgi:hypothetical protein